MNEKPANSQAKRAQRRGRKAGSRDNRPTHWVVAGLGLLAVIAGVLLLVIANGVLASILGAGLIGLSGIAFVSLAFLLVGEGDEDDRLHHPHG